MRDPVVSADGRNHEARQETVRVSSQVHLLRAELSISNLEVLGELPRELAGSYLRNGPNPQFPRPGREHSFDGDGMVHGVRIDNGACSYRNRWVRTKGFLYERELGRPMFGGFGDGFRAPSLRTLRRVGSHKQSANTSLVHHGGRLLTLAEIGVPYELDSSLDTLGPAPFRGGLGRTAGAFTAHPKICPDTGELFGFGYSLFLPMLDYHAIDADGRLFHSEVIHLRNPTMMHDFAITQHHAVFMEAPAVYRIAQGLLSGQVLFWEPELGTRLGIMPRLGPSTGMRWFEVDTCFCFHMVNAFEQSGRVIVDLARWPRLPLGLAGNEVALPTHALLVRFTIDPETGRVREQQLSDRPMEMPQVHPDVTGKPYRYVYFTEHAVTGRTRHAAVRLDLRTGRETAFEFARGQTCGELSIVPDPKGHDESHAFLVGFVRDARAERTELVVLRADDLEAGPVARVLIPHLIPDGFHGLWVGKERLGGAPW